MVQRSVFEPVFDKARVVAAVAFMYFGGKESCAEEALRDYYGEFFVAEPPQMWSYSEFKGLLDWLWEIKR